VTATTGTWTLVALGGLVLGQAGADPAPAAGEGGSAVAVQSVWDFVIKGGPMMIPIGICSLVARRR